MDAIPKTSARTTKHVVGFTRNPSSRECIARETDKFYYNKATTYSRKNTFDYMSMDIGQAAPTECDAIRIKMTAREDSAIGIIEVEVAFKQ